MSKSDEEDLLAAHLPKRAAVNTKRRRVLDDSDSEATEDAPDDACQGYILVEVAAVDGLAKAALLDGCSRLVQRTDAPVLQIALYKRRRKAISPEVRNDPVAVS